MTGAEFLVLAGAAALAFFNGANDVSKGVATLGGSGAATPAAALRWGTGWTALGALAGMVAGGAMVQTFAQALMAAPGHLSLLATGAALLAASACIGAATWARIPVSTTHALVGAIAGVALWMHGTDGVLWHGVGARIAAPLLLSPLVAAAVMVLLFRLQRGQGGRGDGIESGDLCLCVAAEERGVAHDSGGAASLHAVGTAPLRLVAAAADVCARSELAGVRLRGAQLHWLTSAAISFARGLNDAPKIAALVLVTSVAGIEGGGPQTHVVFATVALAMAAGSLLAGSGVTQVLGEKLVNLDPRTGLMANATTAVLVTVGAALGMPMSTTHVSSAAIVATGLGGAQVNRRLLGEMALAWLVTVPVALLLAGATLGAAHAAGLR